jgi:hypothetical protein
VAFVLGGAIATVLVPVAWVSLPWVGCGSAGPLASALPGEEEINWLVRPTPGMDEPEEAPGPS